MVRTLSMGTISESVYSTTHHRSSPIHHSAILHTDFDKPSDFIRAYPMSPMFGEWLTLLIRRVDAVTASTPPPLSTTARILA